MSTSSNTEVENYVILEGVTKSYQTRAGLQTVWRELSVQFPPARVCALIGRSGSGKSTVLNLISGIDGADRGSVSVGGNIISSLNETERTRWRRRDIGFIFQSFNLVPTLTALENVMLPLRLLGLAHEPARVRAAEALARVELESKGLRYGEELSGGEQQRVAIARAFVHEPPLILADEPTGSLDSETGSQVLARLVRLVHEHGRTAIIVTHSDDAISVADCVFRAHAGGIERIG